MPTTAAWQSADDPPPRRPPEINHHRPRLRSAAYQAAPPRRDATPTTLLPGQVLGFPPVRGGRWGIATPDTLQEGIVAPAGVTASEPDEPARISPARQTPPANRSRPAKPPPNYAPSRLRRHQHRLTANTTTRPRRPERRSKRREQQHQGRAGGNHLHRRRAGGPCLRHRRGSRPDAAAGHARPPLARPGPKRAR